MSFHRPELIWLVLALPSLLYLGAWVEGRRWMDLARFQNPGTGPIQVPGAGGNPVGGRGGRSRRGFELLGIAGILVGLGAMGPCLGNPEAEEGGPVAEVILLVDLSRSMTVADISPNRMEVARLVGSRVAMDMPGVPLGLVVFADDAFALLPPTSDHNLLAQYLGMLDPGMVGKQGSVLSGAILEGVRIMDDGSGLVAAGVGTLAGEVAAIVISDGEVHEDQAEALRAAKRAAGSGMKVHAVSVGTPAGGLIPGWAGDDSPRSSARPDFLKALAGSGGGMYAAAQDPPALSSLLGSLMGGPHPGMVGEDRTGDEPVDLSLLCAALAILVLLVDRKLQSLEKTEAREGSF